MKNGAATFEASGPMARRVELHARSAYQRVASHRGGGAVMWEYTFTRRRVGEPARPILCAADVYDQLHDVFDGAETERVVVAALDRKHRPLGRETVYVGTVAGASVRIAELFRMAVRLNASAIVMAHNHPSGDAAPSADDLRTTRDAVAAGALLGIEVLDHIVVGDGCFVSVGEVEREASTTPRDRRR